MQYTPSVDKQASHFVHIPGLSYSGVKSPTECQQSLFESHFASRQSLRSEERFSRNAETDLVCRLLLEKKKTKQIQEKLQKQMEATVVEATSGGRMVSVKMKGIK